MVHLMRGMNFANKVQKKDNTKQQQNMKTQINLDAAGLCYVLTQVLQGHNTSNTASVPVIPKN